MRSDIGVIDLFAGPGGLGEGISAFSRDGVHKPFKIRMSVEMEPSAHRTLQLRAFTRQFPELPRDYYDYIRGVISRETLFERYPDEANRAIEETLGSPRELGESADDELIYTRLRSLKRKHEGPWVVIGGPPCQAYSLVGRARNRGVKDYRPEQDKRHFLYAEYLRVLQTMRPEVFVMENVKGILSSSIENQRIFPSLLVDLRCPDRALGKRTTRQGRYRIYSLVTGHEVGEADTSGSDCIIRSENYGVPQTRHRVILLGVREDISLSPSVLQESPRQWTVGEMLADLPDVRSGISKQLDSHETWASEIAAQAKIVSKELARQGLSCDVVDRGLKKAHRLRTRGGQFVPGNKQFKGPDNLRRWLLDEEIAGFVNHESKAHMPTDLGRYMYCASFAYQTEGLSPRSSEFPEIFAPNHRSWETGKFADRFKVQARNAPSSTIVSHIAKDGHYFIHPDPGQCRSLTVREAARLQTFPDNYFFEGNRTQQYVQVGNAVPPYLAQQIGQIVYELMA
ncbi:DNA cytosine methyltransferase [Thioalkalivibrio sp. XN279]|nr:DNA cytosine methyltransferase [Thioalkalivibrio sp. XN279]